jgi:hypothetical protein
MPQLVVGSADKLAGGDTDDTLVAASGHASVADGEGADTFVFKLDLPMGGHNYMSTRYAAELCGTLGDETTRRRGLPELE